MFQFASCYQEFSLALSAVAAGFYHHFKTKLVHLSICYKIALLIQIFNTYLLRLLNFVKPVILANQRNLRHQPFA